MSRKGARIAIAAVLAAAGTLVSAGNAAAITPTVTQFKLSFGSVPFGLAAGPDGNLWFTDPAFTPAVGRFNLGTHEITEFTQADGLQANSIPRLIAAGPDGNLWFTDPGCLGTGTCEIGTIDPKTAAITEFSSGLNPVAIPEGIAAGPEGNLWFADRGTPKAIGMINPSTHAITEFGAGLTAGSSPEEIVAGPDGNLWFTDLGSTTKAIGMINPNTHVITEFGQANGLNSESYPRAIAAGPDGNLWFTDVGLPPAIGKINPTTHAITEFSAGLNPGSAPNFIAAGPDGDLWFTDNNGKAEAIGRIDPATGAITEFSEGVDQTPSGPTGITAGPDGNMWFADRGGPSTIDRITTPPTARTVSAVATGSTTAVVSGVANGHAQPTSAAVEFGPVGGPTATTPGRSLGTTGGDTAFSAALDGLRPNTAYRARVLVTNPTGTTAGAFLTFTTPQAPPPNTRITKVKISKRGRAIFRFKAIGEASGFQCRLKRSGAHKKAKFKSCRSPKAYKHLKAGKYTFSVRAVGPGGRDPSPAKAKLRLVRSA